MHGSQYDFEIKIQFLASQKFMMLVQTHSTMALLVSTIATLLYSTMTLLAIGST